jgi:predicted ATP-dependent protease
LKHNYTDIESTADILPSSDPFDRIVGQDEAITLVRAAVKQRRHVLLCGVPGIGKSMLARAAASLLPKPNQEIRINPNPKNKDRPIVQVCTIGEIEKSQEPEIVESRFVRPEDIPFEVAIKMGYRCPRCGAFSSPALKQCIECGSAKRAEILGRGAYQGLFRKLDVMLEPAEIEIINHLDGKKDYYVKYSLNADGNVQVTLLRKGDTYPAKRQEIDGHTLVSINSNRFVSVSGSSPVELLGDIKHDPYGSAEDLGMAAYLRVVPGAIHEAHEGILYIDEIGALGTYQKHLLTAMQDGKYPISGHNPNSSGAAVRVDDVPCEFILFAACNVDDVSKILPPLRSRIKGYGYEILLSSWMENNLDNRSSIVEFIAQTVYDDGRIPHFTPEAVNAVIEIAEKMATYLDGERNALTLRLRELGGLVRISGDLAVNDQSDYVEIEHVNASQQLSKGIDSPVLGSFIGRESKSNEPYGDYFF